MSKVRFLTLFPKAENIHLTKDVGMIPFILYKYQGFESTIACYKNGAYAALDTDVQGLKMVFVKRIFNIEFIDSFLFILWNFKKYDVLNMYHWVFKHQLLCLFFKLLKCGNCCTYIKLDAEAKIKSTKGLKLWILEKKFFFINILSVETKEIYMHFKENTRIKIEYIPNGFYDGGRKIDFPFVQKENIILTVGRIGTLQKASEILLEAFKLFSIENIAWKLQIVGQIEPNFNVVIAKYFKENPKLIKMVEFVGPVSEKGKIMEIYGKAKFFILTSRWEGFPLVYLEALHAGCFIISTNISPAFDITNNQQYGMIFPIDDVVALSDCLASAVSNYEILAENCQKSQLYAYENFYWPKIVQKLSLLIKNEL